MSTLELMLAFSAYDFVQLCFFSSAKEKKQKERTSDLNDPEHQNEIF